ncbi:unnamed protein product [Penicillium salamii]|nr:unnamed protein product [Penicillium salamii]
MRLWLANGSRLRRAFLLIDSMHGIKKTDADILRLFRHHAIPHQIILSKVDKFLAKKMKTMKTGVTAANLERLQLLLNGIKPLVQLDPQAGEGPGSLGEILTCSAEAAIGQGRFLGIDAVRWSILSAAGIDGSLEGVRPATESPNTQTTAAF